MVSMIKPLKIGVTGVRGIVGETFTPELVVGFAQAFGTYLDRGRVLVCRDTRASGPMVSAAVAAGLLAAGCEVVDLGVAATPSLQLATKWLEADGGIAITGGHNPSVWNALKFVTRAGVYLNTMEADQLLDIFHQGEFAKATWDQIQTGIQHRDALQYHLRQLNSVFDVEAVKKRRLKVAIDCCNGACSLLIPHWLKALGCEVISINDDPNAPFPHPPEPTQETMSQVSAVVKASRADIGFAFDADGERLGIVTDLGKALSEESTFAVAIHIRLSDRPGPVVTNICTSSAAERIAARYNSTVIRTAVGQAHISEAMIEHSAILGGEGSGGVVVPELQLTHDSAAAVGLILEGLARRGGRISEIAQQLPHLVMVKHNFPVEPNRLYSVLQDFRDAVERERLDYDSTDGVRIDFPDVWVHVRASNTESLVRIIAEAEGAKQAKDILNWTLDKLKI